MITSEYCKGCYTDTFIITLETGATCRTAQYNDNGDCPCSTCIVKMMCANLCDVYIHFCKKEDDSNGS